MGLKHLIIGYNHHFGGREKAILIQLNNVPNHLISKLNRCRDFISEGGAISSSSMREALLQGRLDEANKLLGYSYSVSGTVIAGRKIGRSIGFPTANIKPDDQHKLIPCKGVYAVEVILGGKFYKGMLSIGSNPTVNDDPVLRSIEVHILDFE